MPLIIDSPEDIGIGVRYHTFDEEEYLIIRSVLTGETIDKAREAALKKDGKFKMDVFNYELYRLMLIDYRVLLPDGKEWKLVNETSLHSLPHKFTEWLSAEINARDGALATNATVVIKGVEIPFR